MNLRFHNICWARRYAVWTRYAGSGWWGRGSIISPDMRGFYEKFLPFNEFKHSLITIGEQILESPDWVPKILHSNDILSRLDFWAMLPDAFAGRVTFKEEELFPLFCAIADPSRFGTADNRYPEQLQAIGDFIKRAGQGRAFRLLDLGCGIGLGKVMVESSDKMWSTGEGNGKPLQYSCLENPMNMKYYSQIL